MSQPAHGLAIVIEQIPEPVIGSLPRRRDTHREGDNLGSDNTIGETDNTGPQTDNTQSLALSAKEVRLKVPATSAIQEVLLAAFPRLAGTTENSTERRALNSSANRSARLLLGYRDPKEIQ